jgi:uncharacterized protein
MMIVQKEYVNNIPVLHVVKQSLLDQKIPFIIFIHGFQSAKEHNLHYAYYLSEKGYRVVLPEASFHGEREEFISERELTYRFWDIVVNTIQEIEAIKNHYEQRIDEGRIGVAGTSMGGIVTLGALTQYSWIKAAVSLMGSPVYEDYARRQISEIQKRGYHIPFTEKELEKTFNRLRTYDLSQQPEKLKGRPLMFWHGKNDPIVPFQNAYDFYLSNRDQYENHPEDLFFMLDEQSGHKVSRSGVLKTVEWFSEKL